MRNIYQELMLHIQFTVGTGEAAYASYINSSLNLVGWLSIGLSIPNVVSLRPGFVRPRLLEGNDLYIGWPPWICDSFLQRMA